MWSSNGGKSIGLIPGRETFGPLFLMCVPPFFALLMWYIMYEKHGKLDEFYTEFCLKDGKTFDASYLGSKLSDFVYEKMYLYALDTTAWKVIFSYMAFELALMKIAPGKEFKGVPTAAGNIPIYKANGMQSYFASIAVLLGIHYSGIYNISWVYDNMGQLLACMNIFSLLFCVMLYFKGLYFPSTTDSGSCGNPIIDIFWGTELYPRILGWDIKTFTNCRFGMMYWALGIICYAVKDADNHNGKMRYCMIVSVLLQLIYITKFFYWETGYWNSMDIQHDRAGFYICWGCLVWVPCVYTSATYYLVKGTKDDLTELQAAIVFAIGFFAIWANYSADRQRQIFRESKGECKIWGQKPRKIVARYTTEDGKTKESLLLASGFWGLAPHCHYFFEILAAIMWSAPAGLGWSFDYLIPYFYAVPFLIPLLVDRAFRDDARCEAKYGKYWKEYRKLVPYKVIPGVF